MSALGPKDESEVAAEADFWMYVKPTGLYKLLDERRKQQARFLRRNIAYTRANALRREVRGTRKNTGLGDPRCCVCFAGFDDLSNGPQSSQTLSVFVSLCEEIYTPADRLYRPLENRLIHVDRAGNAELELPKPAIKASGNLVVLFMVWTAHPDLSHLKKAKVSKLCSDVWNGRQWLCFGWLPVGGEVWAAALNVDAGESNERSMFQVMNGNVHQVRSSVANRNRKVDLEVCTLDMYSSECGMHLGITKETREGGHAPSMSIFTSINTPSNSQDIVMKDSVVEARIGEVSTAGHGVATQSVEGSTPPNVYFRYMYNSNLSYLEESVPGYQCPYCSLACSSFSGLRAHLETSHDLFLYVFSVEEGRNIVHVICPEELHDKEGKMVSQETEALMDRRNKNFCMHIPSSMSTFVGRIQQHTFTTRMAWERRSHDNVQATHRGRMCIAVHQNMDCEVSHPPSALNVTTNRGPVSISEVIAPCRQEHCSTFSANRMPLAKTCVQPSNANSLVLSGNEDDWVQQSPYAYPSERDNDLEPYELLSEVVNDDSWRDNHPFYHSQTAMRMTAEEVLAGPDTDDENDLEHRKIQTYRFPVGADSYTPLACMRFSEHHAQILQKSVALRRSFSLFLLNLLQYDILDPESLDKCNVIARGGSVVQGDGTPCWRIAAS
ncbi:hypothetical protein BSKO_01334 [Bryopsis sp. KO-2023]|nr:hypothetical protein BSKO_01334 [Bryopsis sp. KO-2023]